MDAASIKPHWLGRKSPPDAWEAFFLIGVFPGSGELRWVKFQLFSGGRNPGRHCFSALEAMDGPGEELVLLGFGDRIETIRRPLDTPYLSRATETWQVRSSPGLNWTGNWPETKLNYAPLRISATTRASHLHVWASLPGVISYWSAFGSLDWKQDGKLLTGQGIVEHAWGGDSRFNIDRITPPRWQWDVLTFEDGSACAGLMTEIAGRQVGLRSGGTAPGQNFTTGRGIRVKVSNWITEESRRVPQEWAGTMRLGKWQFDYNARKSTPVAAVLPCGGFMGFDFEGRWRGESTVFRGSGFTEYRAA